MNFRIDVFWRRLPGNGQFFLLYWFLNHQEFFSATPKDSLYVIFRKTREHLGEFKGNKLIDWRTNEISGTINKTEYLLVYEVEYDKHTASETISMLKKDGDGAIKIIGYHVQSDGFPF